MIWSYKLILLFFLLSTLEAEYVDFGETDYEETQFNEGEFNIEERLSAEGKRWRTNTFSVEPGGSIEAVEQAYSGKHNLYYVKNFGRQAVTAYITEGSKRNRIASKIVNPGNHVSLDPKGKKETVTRLLIENKGKRRAIFQARQAGPYPPFYTDHKPFRLDLDINGLVKTVAVFGAGYIPVVGPVVSTMLDFFWPSTSSDVWDEIKDKVKVLIDKQMNDLIENLLDSKVRIYKRRIAIISQEIEKKISKKRLSNHFMNIAQDLVGVEEDFRFNNKSSADYEHINYASLPLYSTVVSMKMMYYRLGMAHPEDFGLDEDEVEELKIYASETLYGENGAIAHIKRVGSNRETYTYNNAPAENIYNEMATVKSFVSLHGDMYIDVWKNFIANPKSTTRPFNNALIYNTFVGRPTGDLQAQGASDPPMQHLTAKLVDGKRPKIVKIEGHTKDNVITGLKVLYKGGQTVASGLTTGTKTSGAGFGNVYIKSVVVVGDVERGPFQGLVFFTNDKRQGAFGSMSKGAKTKEIKVDGWHVAGVHISHDGLLFTKSWNLAISWQPDNPNRI